MTDRRQPCRRMAAHRLEPAGFFLEAWPPHHFLAFTDFDNGLNLIRLPASRPLSARCPYPSFDPRQGYLWCTTSSNCSWIRRCTAHHDHGAFPSPYNDGLLTLVYLGLHDQRTGLRRARNILWRHMSGPRPGVERETIG